MNFQCSNCGGNMVYDPESKKMFCEYCNSYDSHKKEGDDSLSVCPSCGGTINVNELTSASRCVYCGNYIVFDKRVSENYKPDSIMPFIISKKKAVECMKDHFKKRVFKPTDFLSEPTLNSFNGFYVPFFLYDYSLTGHMTAEGRKVRTWSSGGYDYQETSYYNIQRRMCCAYDNVPADASLAMEDDKMDLLEPFDYNCLMEFDPKFMSGFFGEIYNTDASTLEHRAKEKVFESARVLMKDSISGYSSVKTISEVYDYNPGKTDYTLLPVWLYFYKYKDKTYRFFVNGQSGKVAGETPVSVKKVVSYGLTMGGILILLIKILLCILEVL